MVQLTIVQHWFRWWLDAVQATSHYLKYWWLIHRRIYASLGIQELNNRTLLNKILYSIIPNAIRVFHKNARENVVFYCAIYNILFRHRRLNPADMTQKQCHHWGIALSSILGKVFGLIIIQRYGHALSSSDLQFSFKERRSTLMCSAAIKEGTSHYLQNQSDVYASMLDAKKAFDKVSFTKHFALLLKRDIPTIILRVVLDLYTRQSVAASWNGCTFNPFSVTNGVRQDGVLSPILFNVYLHELFDKLKMNDVGCHSGRQFTGAFCFVDDLTLLSPTIRGLQNMLNVCDDFANENSVKFNARKTVCVFFSRKPTCRDINVLLPRENYTGAIMSSTWATLYHTT